MDGSFRESVVYHILYGSDGSDIYHLYGNFLDETVQRKEVLIDWINS